MSAILTADEHLQILLIFGMISGQSAMKVALFTWIAKALAPVAKRNINLLLGQRRVPPAYLKL
jgi:hypothetical protein